MKFTFIHYKYMHHTERLKLHITTEAENSLHRQAGRQAHQADKHT